MLITAVKVLLVLIAVIFSGCALEEISADDVVVELRQYPPSKLDELSEIDYAVYGAILSRNNSNIYNRVSVVNETDSRITPVMVEETLSGISPEIVENFNAKAARAVLLKSRFPIHKDIILFTQPESDEDFNEYFKYGSYYVFSRVGFSEDDKEALVYVDYHCPLCGEGAYYWLRNINGKWEIVDKRQTWVS